MTQMPFPRRSLLLASAGLLATPAITRAAPPALRVGNQKGGLRSLLDASGAAKDLPFPIEWSEFPAAAPLLEALSADALDVGTMGDLAFLSVFASGAPLRAYAATRADPKSQAILVRGDSAFRSLADLRGKRVAGNRGGWGQFLVRAALKRAGLEAGAVEHVFLGPAEAALAFRSGSVDAWAIWEPYVSIEVERFGARVLLDGTGLTPTISFLAAHENALRNRRPQLAELMQRQRAGWAWADGHIPEYAATNARLTRLPEDAVRRAFNVQRTRAIPLDSEVVAELQDAADRSVEFGLLRERLDVTRALDTGFAL
ncbi:ABC transporter substrate-binding protein [Roseomonas chloroacetimidivorans]|jgi:sulfonate transport system substrate-binding protein|uniref:ABC transporter substrate-binding protein n=1 Tax=Roseomonas chloroacetimidivorans TaxID=1766656 RepID=UPI003C7128EA